MRYFTFTSLVMFLLLFTQPEGHTAMSYNPLTPEEERVIIHKGTEPPFSGKYLDNKAPGTYACKRCGAHLFRSDDKFNSYTGWPSFDDSFPEAVKRVPDADGMRTEIVCSVCGAHLGHVFLDEGFTPKNTRHCVNSISLTFIPSDTPRKTETAIFAAGCFWGVEYRFQQVKGVESVTSGYTGGEMENPSYQDVSSGTTGHAEAVKVVFDPEQVSYEALVKMFFELHDFTQVNRQGPDIGEQYRTEIFYFNQAQKEMAQKYIDILIDRGFEVATKLTPAQQFWVAEPYHQNYYQKRKITPRCLLPQELF